jgi:hypothetical protein
MKKTDNVEIVLSTIENTGKDVANALFWKECYHKEEVTQQMLGNGKQWYEYHVKFDGGLKPIQLNKTNKLRKPLVAK